MYKTTEVSLMTESKWIPLNKGKLKFKILLSKEEAAAYVNENGKIAGGPSNKLVIVDESNFANIIQKQLQEQLQNGVYQKVNTSVRGAVEDVFKKAEDIKPLIKTARDLSLSLERLTDLMRRISLEEKALRSLKNRDPFRSAKQVINDMLKKEFVLFRKSLLKEVQEAVKKTEEVRREVKKKPIRRRITENTPVVMLTVGQLAEYFKGRPGTAAGPDQRKYIYGLRGIRNRYGVGTNTACSWASGLLAPAVIREGRKIIVDTEKADRILEQWTQEQRSKRK